MADWIVDMLDAAGVDKAMVVGHSMGSLVAMETAARHPDRVSKLALIATASPMPVSDPLLNAARENKHEAFDMINLWGHSQYGQMGGNQAPGMWMSGSAIRLLERSGPGVLFAGLNACNEYKHGMESAAKVQCPTLLVLGSLDVMTPARVARKLEQVIPDVRSEVLNNCGHLIMAEKPNQLLDLLVDFLD